MPPHTPRIVQGARPRKKARDAGESEEAPRESLAVRALRAGIGQGEALGFGPERDKAQKELYKKVSRAELSVEERDAQIERREDERAAEQSVDVRNALNALQIERRAELELELDQSVDVRDALNARRRANEQVTISVRLALRALYTPVRLVFGVFPTNPY